MAAPSLPAPNADLDYLLAEVAKALQLTREQYALAAKHYDAVARWLGAPGSALAGFKPVIYPQGSMALETTVRPLSREEYDLDLVCQMQPTGLSALELYNTLYARLRDNKMYDGKLEKMNRCVRLNYEHDFHLDIIPAEPDMSRGGGAIVVPDRELRDWTPSNPEGYVIWFTDRSRETVAEFRRKIDPIPTPTPVDEKPALTIAVQLIKRRRDMICDEETAPRSIVLTTLAGECYQGTNCILTALMQIVGGIQRRIQSAHPARITVCNPTNPDERFCESFDAEGRYAAFKRFVGQLERDLDRISALHGIAAIQNVLTETFGEEPVSHAVRSYGVLLKKQRDGGSLKFSGAGMGSLSIIAPTAGTPHVVPANRYSGD